MMKSDTGKGFSLKNKLYTENFSENIMAEEKKTDAPQNKQTQLKDLLKHRIANPLTGNDIYVKSALGYAADSSVRKTAVAYIQKNMR